MKRVTTTLFLSAAVAAALLSEAGLTVVTNVSAQALDDPFRNPFANSKERGSQQGAGSGLEKSKERGSEQVAGVTI